MAAWVFIGCALNNEEWVIDIKGSSSDSGTSLDAFPQKPDCNDNQQWQLVPSSVVNPNGSGNTYYYFIQSKLNTKNVITANGSSLQASAQKSPPSNDQLWESSFANVTNSDGFEFYYIQSAKDGSAITIPDGTKNSGTLLQLSSLTNSQNQQWTYGGQNIGK
jgi:hypothetical protein